MCVIQYKGLFRLLYVLLLYVLLCLYQSSVVLQSRVSGISTWQDTNNLPEEN